MTHFFIAFNTILPLFVIIAAGMIFSRTKVSSDNWIEILNKYALYIGFPALVVASLLKLETGEQSFLKLIIYTSLYVVFCMLLAFPIARIFRLSKTMLRSLFLILPFGNFAYLGMPVLQNAYGDEIMPAAAIISAVYLFWLLTLGIILIEVFGEDHLHPKKLIFSLIQNPLLISVFAGLAIVFFKITMPDFAEKTIGIFAESVTGVVLFSLGIFLGMQKVGNIKEWRNVFILVGVTMLVLPFLFFLFLKSSNFDSQLLKASVIDAAMPLGITPYALSELYKLETKLVARVVVLGTLLSMVITPLWMIWVG
jgi:predicted permease